MSNKGKNHSKKWLITRLKTSGSKRRYVLDGDYSDTRNSKSNKDWDNLPTHEGMGKSFKFFNNKVNYGLLIRFLRGKVDSDWSSVHEEIMERIPSDLLEYKDCVTWFVADLVEKHHNKIWDKREQKYLLLDRNEIADFNQYITKEFYVDPDNNKLVRVADFSSLKKTKGMSNEELRKFREQEKQTKLEEKRAKKSEIEKIANKADEILRIKDDKE